MTVKIITDSTCDLPQEIIDELDITVIPLYINIGEKGYLDGVEISRKDFYSQLPNYETHPSTATPGIDAFLTTFKKLAEEGASEIISIHISKNLSATLDIAESATNEFDEIPVYVRDSLQLSMGTGFQVEAAARMAKEGKSVPEILTALEDLAKRTMVTAGLDTLEYLKRSGRMNAFMTGIGSFIKLKPILIMKHGIPKTERVRTSVKARNRLGEMLKDNQPIERFVLLHTNAKEEADNFRALIAKYLPDEAVISMDITPVIGAHLGPGAVGYAIVSKNPIKEG